MKARLLKFLNFPGILLLSLVFITLQSTLFTNHTLAFFQPDAVMFLIIWIAMKRSFREGGILTLILGDFVELHSAAPSGLFLCNYMFLFLLARFLYKNFHIVNRRGLVLVGLVAGLLGRINILFILYLMNKADNQWFHTLQLLAPTAIIHMILIVPVFTFLHKFDIWTLKNPEAEHRFERDFYLDEEPI